MSSGLRGPIFKYYYQSFGFNTIHQPDRKSMKGNKSTKMNWTTTLMLMKHEKEAITNRTAV